MGYAADSRPSRDFEQGADRRLSGSACLAVGPIRWRDVHCVDKEERKAFIKAYRDFVADYQTAMAALHQGVEEACFPEAGIRPGCYWQGGAG